MMIDEAESLATLDGMLAHDAAKLKRVQSEVERKAMWERIDKILDARLNLICK